MTKASSLLAKRLSFQTVDKYDRMADGNQNFSSFDSFDDLSDNYAMAGGAIASRSTEPYVLTIANGGVGVETAIIFGRNRFSDQANFGSGANITITLGIGGATYGQMLQQSAIEPFEIVKLRFSSTSIPQLDTSLSYVKTDSNGTNASTPITVSSYLSPNQFQPTLRDVDYRAQVDGNTHLTYPIINGVSVPSLDSITGDRQ